MRKVKFEEYTNQTGWVAGNGLFHQWAASSIEYESGPGNYTVALVETDDGAIHEVLPTKLIFLDKPENSQQ